MAGGVPSCDWSPTFWRFGARPRYGRGGVSGQTLSGTRHPRRVQHFAYDAGAILFCFACLYLATAGSRPISVDAMMGKKKTDGGGLHAKIPRCSMSPTQTAQPRKTPVIC